jgi:hypothetical protein
VEQVVPIFLQQGATGILALAFLVMVVLWYRADKRNQGYYQRVNDVSFDRSQLLNVIKEHTRVSAAMVAQLAEMGRGQADCREEARRLHQHLDEAPRVVHTGKD